MLGRQDLFEKWILQVSNLDTLKITLCSPYRKLLVSPQPSLQSMIWEVEVVVPIVQESGEPETTPVAK